MMKLNKYTAIALAAVAFAGCGKMDELAPQGSTLLASQVKETNAKVPEKAIIGKPQSSGRPSAEPPP